MTATTDVPRDVALAGLPLLMNPQRMGSIIGKSLLKSGGRLLSCRPTYVRYKPETSCIVAYDFEWSDSSEKRERAICYAKCHTQEDFSHAADKAAARDWSGVEGIRAFASVPAENTLVYLFPNDAEMDHLQLVAQPKKIQRILYEHHTVWPADVWRVSDSRLQILPIRYKPEKRAVVRVDTRAVHRETGEKRNVRVYLRTYNDDSGIELFERMKQLHSTFDADPSVVVPRPLAYLKDRRTLVVDNIPGNPMEGRPRAVDAASLVSAAGSALARLHTSRVSAAPTRDVRDLLEDARETCCSLARVAPDAGRDAEGVLESLDSRVETMVGSNVTFVHGDFYYGQVLIDGERVGLLDFDRSYLGDPMADVGNFIAHVRILGAGAGAATADDCAQEFVDSYRAASGVGIDRERVAFWTAFGLLQLAVSPFRTLTPGWKARMAEVIAMCREVLE